MERSDRTLTAAAALLITALGFLPFADWIAGGPAMPGWGDLAGGWWSGTLTVLGGSIVVAMLLRKRAALPGEGVPALLAESFATAPWRWAAGLGLLGLAIYLWIAHEVFSARPLLIDEIVQVYQGRIFASGALSLPVPEFPEFFSTSHVLNLSGRVFSQFPAGGPGMLALGSLVGAEWVTAPVFGAVSVLLFTALARRIETRPGVALAASVLFAVAPFVAFMSGSHMNHVTVLTWLLLGMLGLARAMDRPVPHVIDGLMLGLGLGIAATIRPLDAAAFALPAGVWLLARTIRTGSWPALISAGVGVAIPVLVMLWINQVTTGAALTFGYTALWGASHDLGFHLSPYGDPHTPVRGFELLNTYFVRLQSYLFETPVPSLVPAIGALALTRRLTAFDRYLFASGGLVLLLYWAYWHDGFYLGPRFLFPLAPMLALWSARLWPAVRSRFPSPIVARTLAFSILAAAGIALFVSVPLRALQYRNGMLTLKWDADGAARRAGVRHGLVFVRESWVAQMVARMWAAGLERADAERQYRHSDACAMELALRQIEQRGLRGPAALQALAPLLEDSARLVRSPYTSDPTNRLLPGSSYAPVCKARLAEDQQGYTLLLPLILARDADVIYARDLHARDSLLLERHPDRGVFLLRPATAAVGAEPQFYPLSRDSLLAAWRKGE